MGTNCALLLAGLNFYSHEAEFVQKLLRDNNNDDDDNGNNNNKKQKTKQNKPSCVL
jgi:hypothetical protein